MTTLSGPWELHQVQNYLQSEAVPLRLGCRTPDGKPWMISLWYLYEDNALWSATGEGARILDYLHHDPVCSFEVSPNEPPYRGVRGRGEVQIQPDNDKRLLNRLITRYLGNTDSNLARTLLNADRHEYALRLEPEIMATWDYSERMSDVRSSG